MDKRDFQIGVGAEPDGSIGPKTIAAFYDCITNTKAPAIGSGGIAEIAGKIGCTPKQIQAVAKVETSGGGFTKTGRPKILYERHIFHRITGGRFGTTFYSNSLYGGYGDDSWSKLEAALRVDPWAAIMSCSWGKFQIMGYHASGAPIKGALNLGYRTPLDMVKAMAADEYDHYDAFIRYIRAASLTQALRAISKNPDANSAFVLGYNGPAGIKRNNYHVKLAEAMK